MRSRQRVLGVERSDAGLSVVLAFDPREVGLVRRGRYTAVTLDRGVPRGRPGEPALPWRKVHVLVPDGAQVSRLSVDARQPVRISDHVLVEPVQPRVPTAPGGAAPGAVPPAPGMERPAPVGPDPQAYERVVDWPSTPGRLLVVRQVDGQRVAEIEVCPLAYHPRERTLDLVRELVLTLETQPSRRRGPGPDRPDRRGAERLRRLVVNPEHVPEARAEVPRDQESPARHLPYVVVTSRAMAPAFQPLADWRGMGGLPARVVAVEDIRANAVPGADGVVFNLPSGYPDGGTRDLAEAVRNFVKWAHLTWDTEYVVLGGDTDVIPAREGWQPLQWIWRGDLDVPDRSLDLMWSVTASTSAPGCEPERVRDGDPVTSWSCDGADPAPWIAPGLAYPGRPVNGIHLEWTRAAAIGCVVEASPDGAGWAELPTTVTDDGGASDVAFPCTEQPYLRLRVTGGTDFAICTMNVFGPFNADAAYRLTPTCTRVYLLDPWEIHPNAAHDPSGEELVVVDGPRAGTVVPYDESADDETLGWRFVTALMALPGSVSPDPTPFLEIRGPAEYHGWMLALKNWLTSIPTDLYYADLASPDPAHHDWDANDNGIYGELYGPGTDGVNRFVDVHVGRLPAATPEQAAALVGKIIDYEKYRDSSRPGAPLPRDFARTALLVAHNWYGPSPGYLDAAASCNEEIRRMLLATGDPWTFVRRYEDSEDVPAADVTADLGDADPTAVRSALAQGGNVVSLVSHGNEVYVCSLSDLDVDDEPIPPSVWYANACTTNAFDRHTIAEAAVLNEHGGAVAYVGNSRYGWTSDGPIERAFWAELLDSGRLGDMLENAHLVGDDWEKYSLNLLGDPAMRVWSAPPRTLTVVHELQQVGVGEPGEIRVCVRSGDDPVPDATVSVFAPGPGLVTGVTDECGRAVLTTRTGGRIRLAVTGRNLLPYLLTGDPVAVPDLLRLSTRQAFKRLCRAGLQPGISGAVRPGAYVWKQVPAPGTVVLTGGTVRIFLHRPGHPHRPHHQG